MTPSAAFEFRTRSPDALFSNGSSAPCGIAIPERLEISRLALRLVRTRSRTKDEVEVCLVSLSVDAAVAGTTSERTRKLKVRKIRWGMLDDGKGIDVESTSSDA